MKVREVQIKNFRCIKSLKWCPGEGINCLIGHGDSGKSTILEAIEHCIGLRRNIQYYDSDFYNMDISNGIEISVSIGNLDDSFKNIETYGLFWRGYDLESKAIIDEPDDKCELIVTMKLTVGDDLVPVWSLYSDRANEQCVMRDLSYKDKGKLAPAKIGVLASYNLGWKQGSVLNKLTEEKAENASAFALAGRQAREAFGGSAERHLKETLEIVAKTATDLGVQVGSKVRALLDAQSVSFSEGAISLHMENGIPLRGLGIGSTRLLIAGLQRKAFYKSSMIVIDEIEYGLEPHRIIRFLASIGAKEQSPPFQAFITTHSPVVLRELSGNQLYVTRKRQDSHDVCIVGVSEQAQSTIRCYPEAYLATSIIVCEGASEVGFIRGIDLFRQSLDEPSIYASGTMLIDGGGVSKLLRRATAFLELGYRVAILRDDDVSPDKSEEINFIKLGGKVFRWHKRRNIEEEIFLSLPDCAIARLLEHAAIIHGEQTIDEHIKSASGNRHGYVDFPRHDNFCEISVADRLELVKASSGKAKPWFKQVAAMEGMAQSCIGPNFQNCDSGFKVRVKRMFRWALNV